MKKYLTLLFLVCAVALTFTGCYNSFESVGLSDDGNHSSGGTGNPGGGSSNTVILSPDTSLPGASEYRGSVSGNKMTFKNTPMGQENLVLIKQ